MTAPAPPSALRIGTRASPLALAQAREVATRLAAAHPDLTGPAVEIVPIRTTGDRVTDRPLAAIGGKGLFTKEIEEALLDGRVDIAVHSMKDIPTSLPGGLVIDCLLPREDPRDALILSPALRAAAGSAGGTEGAAGDAAGVLALLPAGAVVGTSSLRRHALLRYRRPDIQVVPFRGNVDTRLAKLAEGEAQATFLAMAGLNRLGRQGIGAHALAPEAMLPAVAQGAIGIERREADERIAALLEPLADADCLHRVAVERAFLAELDGSCRTPIAGLAELLPGTAAAQPRLRFRGAIAAPDGAGAHFTEWEAPLAEAEAMARAAARGLLAEAGPGFLLS